MPVWEKSYWDDGVLGGLGKMLFGDVSESVGNTIKWIGIGLGIFAALVMTIFLFRYARGKTSLILPYH
jgi:hypothetical protein